MDKTIKLELTSYELFVVTLALVVFKENTLQTSRTINATKSITSKIEAARTKT